MQTSDFREQRGEAIARQFGWVKRVDEHFYKVHSQSGDFEYEVMSTEVGWVCNCPDSMFRGSKCKHIHAVELSFILRKIVARQTVTIQAVNVQGCPKCSSDSIKKGGLRHNKAGDLQKYRCKDCGYWFTINLGFEKVQATPQAITGAMQLYFTGESLRNVQKFLRLQGVKVSHVCVYKWIGKYVRLMDEYLVKIQPQVGDKWRTDELYLKVKGDRKYLFAMLDDETRFWIAQQIADNKGTSDVRPMFKQSIQIAGKRPNVLTSDGAPNFHRAYNKEFWTMKGPRTEHEAHIHLSGDMNNNKMESFNGELRDREKTMRSLKTVDSPVLKGLQIYHNYLRPHMGLDGKTPADMAGIGIEGENKWLTIIQNAQMTRVNSQKIREEMTKS
jgi:transposase-like protein